jgi:hypothetical protein
MRESHRTKPGTKGLFPQKIQNRIVKAVRIPVIQPKVFFQSPISDIFSYLGRLLRVIRLSRDALIKGCQLAELAGGAISTHILDSECPSCAASCGLDPREMTTAYTRTHNQRDLGKTAGVYLVGEFTKRGRRGHAALHISWLLYVQRL